MSEESIPPEQPEEMPSGTHGSTRKAFDDLKDAAKRAFDETVREARQSADQAVPKAKEGLERAASELIHDLAFASEFTATVIRNIVPEDAVKASQKGAAAGQEAAEEFLRKRKEKNVTPAAPPTPEDPAPAAG